MKKRGSFAVLFVLVAALSSAPLRSAEEPARDDTFRKHMRPPKNLKQMPDGHWTPWNPPAVPEGANVHVIVRGDTLWDLSATNLKNPYLWPHIWDLNRYVLDSHWIYPGDPIVLPGNLEVVPPETGAPVAQAMEGESDDDWADDMEGGGGGGGETLAPPTGPSRHAIGHLQDFYCATYIQDEPLGDNEARIVAADEPQVYSLGEGNIVYLDSGRDDGLKPGDRFMVLRNSGRVKHPVTGDGLGHRIDMRGQLSIIAVQDNAATAEITFSCEEITRGDVIVPYRDIPIPTRSTPLASKIDRYAPDPSRKTDGYVVLSKDPQHALGEGNIADIDLGHSDGLEPGDVISIYRMNPEGEDLPRVNLGEGVVLMTEARTSVVRISASVKEIYLGDRVEVQ